MFYTKGVAAMGGCKVLEHHIPTYDATVVTRLVQALSGYAGATAAGLLLRFSGNWHRMVDP